MDSALAVLLDYPSGPPPDVTPDAVADLTAWWSATPLCDVQRRYVADFDLTGPCSLFVTYHRFGDDRGRGRALVALTRLLRTSGWELEHWELPDYLPVLVELAAADPDVGMSLLREYRPELEQIAEALNGRESPWACAVDLVLDEARAEAAVA